jgi:signal transduction histidine kinase
LAVWLALGWPVLDNLVTGTPMRGAAVPPLWLVPFGLFGAAVFAAMVLNLRPALLWPLLCIQVAAVAGMAIIVPWAMMAVFLIITAWQAGMETAPARALSWVAFQTLVVIAALAQALNPDMCWIIGLAAALQLFFVYTAQTARALTETNEQLRAAQALIASTVRNAERLRISRELHDAWGHELTALGLQLEIASHVREAERANAHVLQAKGLARGLLGKVRDVVSTLREAERTELNEALQELARSVPTPVIHVEIAPSIQVTPDQSHALIRCAQEAVTNAIRHAQASNLWLHVTCEGDGVRLVARDDGSARPAFSPGTGLRGMRERVESLGGKLAVRSGGGFGFTVDAWLPARNPQPA